MPPPVQPSGVPVNQVNLQTLVAAIQNAVQAQNLIATNVAKLTAAFGVAFPAPLSGSSAWTPGGISAGSTAAHSMVVSGVALGNYVQASIGEDLQDCQLSAYVQGANTVTATIFNGTGSTVTFASTTLKARVTTV